jgi:hypothetical protein
MDLYCQRCGEAWDFWSVKPDYDDGDFTPVEAADFKEGKSCPACKGRDMCTLQISCQDCEHGAENSQGCFSCTQNRFKKPFRAEIASVLSDILGDDVDGLASEMEDAEMMLGSNFWE